MKLQNKVAVITGAGSGLGAALAERFAHEGARLIVADIATDAVQRVAQRCGGVAITCDVTSEQAVQDLVARTEAEIGPIDLFCSNAGVCLGEGDHAASASNETWQLCWDIHVMAHVYAARAVLPGMLRRGEGYLLQMASAAGLLSHIGDAAYSATKHAAVGFAESLAISHGDAGIKVSVICPQYVATPMLGYTATGDQSPPGLMTPARAAEVVVEGIDREAFLILPHPDVAKFIQHKAADYDRWLGGMRKLRRRIIDEAGSTRLEVMHRLV